MLFIHIGRGKVGSTTIQQHIATNADSLSGLGFSFPYHPDKEAGHFYGLANALLGLGDAWTLDSLADALRPADAKVLISSEFLFDLPEESIASLKEIAGAHEVRIIGYLRPYGPWVRSLYAQDVRKGRWSSDFDEYFKVVADADWLSATPSLLRWAAAFGGENVHVRSNASVIEDFDEFLGLSLPSPDVHNRTPHWLWVEFRRAAWDVLGSRRSDFELLLQATLRKLDVPEAEYLTLDQRKFLHDAYVRDIEQLGTNASVRIDLPAGPGSEEERSFLPTLRAAPNVFRKAFLKRCRRQFPEIEISGLFN